MGFVKNPIYLKIIIPWLAIILAAQISMIKPEYFITLFIIDVWLLSHPHAVSTFFMKDAFDRLKKKHLFGILISLAIIFTLVSLKYGYNKLFNIYFFAQWFHYMRQNYGITISYCQRRSNRSFKLQKFLLHILPTFALVSLFDKGSLSFFGHFIYFPSLPNQIGPFLKNLYLAALPIWLFIEIINKNINWRADFNYYLYFLSNYILYYLAYFIFTKFIYGWLSLTLYHNIQYLVFTWIKSNQKSAEQVFYKYYFLITLASLFIYGIIELKEVTFIAYAIPLSLVATLTFNFTHYIYDSVIWRKS